MMSGRPCSADQRSRRPGDQFAKRSWRRNRRRPADGVDAPANSGRQQKNKPHHPHPATHRHDVPVRTLHDLRPRLDTAPQAARCAGLTVRRHQSSGRCQSSQSGASAPGRRRGADALRQVRDRRHLVLAEREVENVEIGADAFRLALFGMVTTPGCWMSQRSTTCAGDLPFLAAISAITGSASTPRGRAARRR